MTGPDLDDLHATLAVVARPRYAQETDPHEGNAVPGEPAIRLVDYMGDLDDYYVVNLVGPYPDTANRDQELARLRSLPLGSEEYHGGYEFLPSTMAVTGDGQVVRTVAPDRITAAQTVAEFYAAFHGWATENADTNPDQGALFPVGGDDR